MIQLFFIIIILNMGFNFFYLLWNWAWIYTIKIFRLLLKTSKAQLGYVVLSGPIFMTENDKLFFVLWIRIQDFSAVWVRIWILKEQYIDQNQNISGSSAKMSKYATLFFFCSFLPGRTEEIAEDEEEIMEDGEEIAEDLVEIAEDREEIAEDREEIGVDRMKLKKQRLEFSLYSVPRVSRSAAKDIGLTPEVINSIIIDSQAKVETVAPYCPTPPSEEVGEEEQEPVIQEQEPVETVAPYCPTPPSEEVGEEEEPVVKEEEELMVQEQVLVVQEEVDLNSFMKDGDINDIGTVQKW